ncbi:hypothetical protein [Pseudovibrio sp. Ad26]|uniref:hypothetical protein n=1 Tax=Pseudovibrio sp. Ad26 TaxID=989410 RepID=UPI0007AEBD74|nr:hypothetical protein [Pseudovibrio sp. Ad26]KZL03586.1 hypothetical protein PsAD26_04662 [Pseudovibrio sp. Ad26]
MITEKLTENLKEISTVAERLMALEITLAGELAETFGVDPEYIAGEGTPFEDEFTNLFNPTHSFDERLKMLQHTIECLSKIQAGEGGRVEGVSPVKAAEKVDYDQVAVAPFKNDLAGMSDEHIARERREVEDRLDEDTPWLEALCAEQKIRSE